MQLNRAVACGVIGALIALSMVPAHAAQKVTPGSGCKVLNQKIIYIDKKYTCVKVGKKMQWNKGVKVIPAPIVPTAEKTAASEKAAAEKAAAEKVEAERIAAEKSKADQAAAAKAAAEQLAVLKLAAEKAAAYRASLPVCPPGGVCTVGSIGPGGGVIFYVAATAQPWGRYLEVAPATWAGGYVDPYTQWCSLGDSLLAAYINEPQAIKRNSSALGSGKENTKLMFSSCMKGIAHLVASYRGGGKSDWYIPSADEMDVLLKENAIVGDLSVSSYWSSTLAPVYGAWDQRIPVGINYTSDETNASAVRPIRASG